MLKFDEYYFRDANGQMGENHGGSHFPQCLMTRDKKRRAKELGGNQGAKRCQLEEVERKTSGARRQRRRPATRTTGANATTTATNTAAGADLCRGRGTWSCECGRFNMGDWADSPRRGRGGVTRSRRGRPCPTTSTARCPARGCGAECGTASSHSAGLGDRSAMDGRWPQRVSPPNAHSASSISRAPALPRRAPLPQGSTRQPPASSDVSKFYWGCRGRGWREADALAETL